MTSGSRSLRPAPGTVSKTVPIRAAQPATTLSESQQRALRVLLGHMIPASSAHGVPGADDELIFADVLASGAAQPAIIERALTRLDAVAGGAFASLDAADQLRAARAFGEERSPPATALMGLVAQCYYRDDRVMRSLGMEVRPPYPRGYEVEQGDWSLLDPVRARKSIYRQA